MKTFSHFKHMILIAGCVFLLTVCFGTLCGAEDGSGKTHEPVIIETQHHGAQAASEEKVSEEAEVKEQADANAVTDTSPEDNTAKAESMDENGKGEAKGEQKEDIYSEDLKPLDTRECARCHYSVYMTIKDAIAEGKGAHRLDCKFCHEKFHSFQRGLTWDERVPHCQNCHDLPHGDAAPMSQCLKCHSNAHAPLVSIKIGAVEPYCDRCHAQQKEEMTKFPSGHATVECATCHHDRHGYRPDCTECHEEPHTPFKSNAGCMECHPPHMPTNLNYGPDLPDEVCAGCHDGPAGRMKATRSAHGKLHCVFCHAKKHGDIPECQSCHSIPHAEKMIDKFGSCSKCHGNPHDLNMVRPGHGEK